MGQNQSIESSTLYPEPTLVDSPRLNDLMKFDNITIYFNGESYEVRMTNHRQPLSRECVEYLVQHREAFPQEAIHITTGVYEYVQKQSHSGITFDLFAVKAESVVGGVGSNYKREHKSPTDMKFVTSQSHTPGGCGCKYNVLQSGLMDLVSDAYNQHHSLSLRPDDIWSTIMMQFALYVQSNSEQFRSRLVKFAEESKTLIVWGNGSLATANYPLLCDKITDQMLKYVTDPDIKNWILPSFTTTTQVDRAIGALTLMATMKHYFKYEFHLRCGIPSITLCGTREDWVQLRAKATKLLSFDLVTDKEPEGLMTQWSRLLFPVLDQFINVFDNKIDLNWWQQICDYRRASGPPTLSGWITVFCLYDNQKKVTIHRPSHPAMFPRTSAWPCIECGNLPNGNLEVEVLIDDNGVKYQSIFRAGIMSQGVVDDTTVKAIHQWQLFSRQIE
jgi:hypothetical protein